MSFVVYLIGLFIAVSSVLSGLNWLIAPAPPPGLHASASVDDRHAAQKRKKHAKQNKAAGQGQSGQTKSDTEEHAAKKRDAPSADAGTHFARATGDDARDDARRQCDVVSCRRAYSSFRASDCTYQPFHGPRRHCGKSGRSAKNGARNASRQALRSRAQAATGCNIAACERAYRTFDRGTCTFRPYGAGTRRHCGIR